MRNTPTLYEETVPADGEREPSFPEDGEQELAERNLMALLGIDRACLASLRAYLDACRENGGEITYERIGKWLAENRH